MSPSEKAAAVARVDQYLLAGQSLNAACKLASVPKASYKGWKRKLDAHGLIRDDRTLSSGRKAKFQLTETETNALRGLTMKHNSFAFAVEVFARSPQCSDATSEMITSVLTEAQRHQRQPKFPLALQRLARSSDLEDDMIRGPKAADGHADGSTKGMFWETLEGELRPIGPMAVWQLDDYSTNQPYAIPTLENGQRLCRQILAALDVYSSGWLGVHHVGRERDAYRVEDILRFILHLIDAHGTMPEALMLEQGRWKAEAILGIELPDGSGRRWGALNDLFHVIHGYTSRHKAALESNFRILQTALRLSGRDIGSYRGEMEGGTKSYLKVQNGKLDATRAGFLTQADSSQIHEEAMQYLNARGKYRKAFGGRHLVPDALLNDLWTPRPLPAGERWRFHPVKKLASVKGNFVECRAGEHYEGHFIFRVNGILDDIYFQPGHKVLIAFDPLHLERGAILANAERGTLNRCGWRMGQNLLTAPPYEMTPQFSFRPHQVETAPQKKANAAVVSSFKAIRPFCKPGLAITHMADGRGQSAEIRRNENPDAVLGRDPGAEPFAANSANPLRGISEVKTTSDRTRSQAPPKNATSRVFSETDESELEAAERDLALKGY